jgi:site-specific recombinase XerD
VLTVNGKGTKQRMVTLPCQWTDLFQGYLKMWPKSRRPWNPFFWCGPKADRRITPAAIDYLVKRAAGEAEIPRLHPHALRHTAATLAIAGGVSLPAVKSKLGHSSILTTMRYIRNLA